MVTDGDTAGDTSRNNGLQFIGYYWYYKGIMAYNVQGYTNYILVISKG